VDLATSRPKTHSEVCDVRTQMGGEVMGGAFRERVCVSGGPRQGGWEEVSQLHFRAVVMRFSVVGLLLRFCILV
jgi:hypothetical protein